MNGHVKPPRAAEFLLGLLLPGEYWLPAIGDFEEQFQWRAADEGRYRAQLWYWGQVLRLVPDRLFHTCLWGILMLQNTIAIALRNIRNHRGFAAVNVLGLAVGLAGFIVIALYVRHELSYDRYHEKADRIVRILEFIEMDEGGERSSSVPTPVGPALEVEYPDQVEQAVRFFNFQAPSLSVSYESSTGDTRTFSEDRLFMADASVFEVFDFEVVRGNPAAALRDPFTIAVTEQTAERYFGDADPIGQTLRFEGEHDLTVTAVVKQPPSNTHFSFDALVSFRTLDSDEVLSQNLREHWYWNPTWTYLLLPEGQAVAELEAQLPAFVERHFPEVLHGAATLRLQPLTDIRLGPAYDYEIAPQSDMTYVMLFSAIALFIVLIAAVNFINLTTARATRRAGEIGVRKALGADSGQLFRQFLGESVMNAMLAAIVSIPLIWLALPVLNGLSGKELSFILPLDTDMVALLFGTAAAVGLIAGVFPASLLSRFEPGASLRGRSMTGGTFSSSGWRKALVVGQFALSALLIVGALVVDRQLDHLTTLDLGFEQEEVVLIPSLRLKMLGQYDAFKDELLDNPGITGVTLVEDIPGVGYQTGTYTPEGLQEGMQFHRLFVHDDFADVLGVELAAGREFEEGFSSDADESIIVNETLVRNLDWGSAEDAIGRRIDHRRVVGVYRDFHYASLRREVEPFVLTRMKDDAETLAFAARYIAVRLEADRTESALQEIERTWTAFGADREFDVIFLDSALDSQYRAELNFRRVAGVFAALAIFIACLGMLGLISYTAARRRREFGIRKVIGATTRDLALLMAGGFMKLVGLAIVISWPLAWIVVNAWLDDFAYAIEPGLAPFAVSAVLVAVIAAATLVYHSVSVAGQNPVDSIRSE